MSCGNLAQTKCLTELRHCIYFLSDRVNKKCLGFCHNSKGNAWESCSCTHIKKMAITPYVELFASKREERIDQMKGDRVLRISDAGEVHNLVLLNDKLKVRDKQICLFGRNDNPILSQLTNELFPTGTHHITPH